jgi:low affinity Fe/Cu permease
MRRIMGILEFEKAFATFASQVSRWAGSSAAFFLAAFFIIAWSLSGPYFGFSSEWQMIVNTGTTICTFLMVFVIQNSQNRDGLALQIKLDEIIRAVGSAKNAMIDLEELSQEELDSMKDRFAQIGASARHKRGSRAAPSARKAIAQK